MKAARSDLLARLARLARAVLGRSARPPGKGETVIPARERFLVVRDDLLREYTREEVEHHERAVDPLGGVAPVPFGHLNPVWQRFCAALEPGDRIWRFNAQRVAANGEAVIRSGYVALRAGEPQRPLVATFRTVGPEVALAPLAASTEPVTSDLVSPPRPSVGPPLTKPEAQDLTEATAAGPVAAAPLPDAPTEASVKQTEGGTIASIPRHREPATVE